MRATAEVNATALDRVTGALEACGRTVKHNGHGKAMAQCPAHDDANPSLSIGPRRDGKGIVIKCQAGCATTDVVGALGLKMADLFDDEGLRGAYADRATYAYRGGREVHRKPGKRFLQSGNKDDRSLFGEERIGDAATVYFVEGEKCVLTVESAGAAAVCSAMGAGKAHLADLSALQGKDVVIVADKDGPGREHALQVAGLLDGVAASVRIVAAAVGKDAADHIAADRSLDELVPVEWWPPQPVDGAELLDGLLVTNTTYVVFPDSHSAVAATLWEATTHALPAFEFAPRLVITSPDKRCGKTRLLDIIGGTCCRPLVTVNATVAAVYRSLGGDHPPTLIIDEADTIFGSKKAAENNEDFRALLNAGHQRGRPALRCVGPNQIPTEFSTFAMAALAGIGAMPDTITDRGVNITMRRRAPGEKVSQFRSRRDGPALSRLRDRLAKWATAHVEALRTAEPEMPVEDRAADTWEPLIAVADAAGGHWPETARAACRALVAAADAADEDMSLSIRLVADIKAVFADRTVSFMPSADLVAALHGIEDSPWGDFDMTARKLAQRLRGYGVRPRHNAAKTARGYHLEDLSDAFARYLRPKASDPSGAVPDQRHLPDTSGPPDTSKCPAGNKRPENLAGQEPFPDTWTVPDAPAARHDGARGNPSPAADFIVEHIRRHGDERNELPAVEVIAAGKAAGYTERQLINARHRDGKVYSRRAGRYDDPALDGWLWGLSEDPDPFDGPYHPGEGLTEDLTTVPARDLPTDASAHGGDLFDPPARPICGLCPEELGTEESIERGHCEECHLVLLNAAAARGQEAG